MEQPLFGQIDSDADTNKVNDKPLNRPHVPRSSAVYDDKPAGCFSKCFSKKEEEPAPARKLLRKQSMRQVKDEKKNASKEYVDNLIKEQEKKYNKKYAFERGQF